MEARKEAISREYFHDKNYEDSPRIVIVFITSLRIVFARIVFAFKTFTTFWVRFN